MKHYKVLLTALMAVFLCAFSSSGSVVKPTAFSSVPSDYVAVEEAEEEAVTYSGFVIDISPSSEWVPLLEIRMVDCDDNEFFTSLTPIDEPSVTYAALSAGEFNTTSTYGANTSRDFLVDGVPDIEDANSATGSNFEWSTDASSGIDIHVKPSTARSIKSLLISGSRNASYNDWIENDLVVLRNGETLDVIPFADSPSDENDVYQTTSNSLLNWYEWTVSCS
jgi:hypothetical protein